MEQNKFKIEDCCLTIEQAKELQKLGIDMSNSIFCYNGFGDIYRRIFYKYQSSFRDDMIPTLTNTEMLEMLPIITKNTSVDCSIDVAKDNENYWEVIYIEQNIDVSGTVPFRKKLLRDSLFECMKWFINKLLKS